MDGLTFRPVKEFVVDGLNIQTEKMFPAGHLRCQFAMLTLRELAPVVVSLC
jgi:hypothetical protein